jgi:signal transduction histidine kinase
MAERIRKITLDILFYARERELNPVPLDIRQFAAEVVENVQPRFDRRGVRLVCEFEEPLGGFEADPGLLKAAMINLLDNAVDACSASAGRPEARVVFRVQAGPERVGMSVDDTGQGMTPEQLRKLFTLFYSTKGIQGTGLGLFIAEKIVRQHGGDIVVESTPGRGSHFCVQLPRRQPAPAPPPAEPDLPPPGPEVMAWG